MGFVATKLNFSTLNTGIGNLLPNIARLDNHILRMGGKVTEVFHVAADAAGAINPEVQTLLQHVLEGAVFDFTANQWIGVVFPKQTDATVGVCQVTLAVSQSYFVVVFGAARA